MNRRTPQKSLTTLQMCHSFITGHMTREVSVWGGGLCQGGGVFVTETPPLTVKSGRYASYWNAFLNTITIAQAQ